MLIRFLLAASVLLSAAACGPARSEESRPEDRFELKHDERDRVVRLDKTTGEMAIVIGERLIPIKSAPADTATRAPRQTASAVESPKNPSVEQPPAKSSSAPTPRVPRGVDGRQADESAASRSRVHHATATRFRAVCL